MYRYFFRINDDVQSTTKDNKPEEQFNCDFEDSMCGWTKGTTNENTFYWERFDYATCVDNYNEVNCPTGGEEDNTRWMYLSGSRGNMDDFASLISPEDVSPEGDCFMFEYNFHNGGTDGQGIKALQVESLNENLERYDVIWRLESPDEWGTWEVGQVKITGKSVIISAEKDNSSDSGFVALDDFLGFSHTDLCKTQPDRADPTTTSTTKQPTTTTTPSPFPDCDFEQGLGGWTNGDNIDNQTDLFRFIRTKGSLHQETHDGPEHDHEENPNSKTDFNQKIIKTV